MTSRFGSIGRTALGLALAAATFVVPSAMHVVEAAGTPDIALSKDMPPESLLGDDIPVTLTIANSTGTDGYNLLIRDVLPADVSYVAGSAVPDPLQFPQSDGTTVLVWRNVADSLDGSTVEFGYRIATGSSFDVGATVTNSAEAFVTTDPRVLPNVSPTGEPLPATFTGNDSASDTTTLTPFRVTKAEPSTEDELLRGVHDHQTVYTLTVENNFVNPTTSFDVVDFVPAQLEFLGCGLGDNTTTGEEYTGSGPIPAYGSPLPSGPCVVPSSVTTVEVDPDAGGPLPFGVYTRVEWDGASIAAARGSADLAAGGSFSIDYVAAIALRENTFPGPDPATSNLDNNIGELTTESETGIVNYAEATGDYDGIDEFTSSATELIVAEDVSLHKSASADTFVQGDTIVYTLLVESSEYAVATDTITVTDTLPPTVDFEPVGTSPAPTSGPILEADGSLTYTWALAGLTDPNDTATITIATTVRETYRNGDGTSGAPVASSDTFTNVADLTSTATIITDNDASTTSGIGVVDDSAVSATSGGPGILKEVSEPQPSLTCGDGSGITWNPTSAGGYRPGDRVCFRLDVTFPTALDTLDPLVQDFLPPGFSLESWAYGAGNTVAAGDVSFIDDSPLLTWDLEDIDAAGNTFQVVVQAAVSDPQVASDLDVLDNLMKVRYSNLSGDVFQLRDQAIAEWAEPSIDLDKGVIELNGIAVPGAPADGVVVQEGDVVTYQVTVSNTGSVDALDVSVRDVLPAAITCSTDVSAISDGGACDVGDTWIQWDAADGIDVPAASSVALTYDVTVPAGVSAAAVLVNRAGVRTFTTTTNTGTPFTYTPDDNIDPTLTPNTDPADDVSDIRTATPTIAKTRTTEINDGPNGNNATQATIGETISYTVTVGLPAGVTYFEGVVSDDIDVEKDLLAGTVVAQLNGGALPAGFVLDVDDAGNAWSVSLPDPYPAPSGADQELVVTFDAVLLDVSSNTRNTGTPNRADFDFADANGIDRNVNASVGTRVVEPNVVLDKADGDVDGIVASGDSIVYSLDVTNDDTPPAVSAAYDTVVRDTVPAQLTVLDDLAGVPVIDGGTVGPDNGIWDAGSRTITWNIAEIAPGATVTLRYETVVGTVIAGATIENTAVATTTSMPGDVPGERTSTSPNAGPGSGYEDTADNTVIVPGFTLDKLATPDTATIGETITYTVAVTIPARIVAFDVTVIDDVPAGITFESLVSVTCDAGGPCSPDITTADVAPSAPGGSGGDVAFFLGDLTTPSTTDRVVTITYTAFVSDVPAADAGATLTNGAAVYWNTTDTITTPPTVVPNPGGFDGNTPPATDDVDTIEPSLSIDKDVAGQNADDDTRRAVPGDVLEYSVTIVNDGSGPAFDVVVRDIPTDESWAFTDTTALLGVINTDSDPVGGLEWTIDGPIAASGGSVTITYQLTVPPGFTSTDENPLGPEQSNTADVPSYFGVPAIVRASDPGRFREYDDVDPDTVTIELDLASLGDLVWFDVDGDGIRDVGEPGIGGVDVIITYLGPDGVPGGGDDEDFSVTTQPDGTYLAENLPGGLYTVDVDETDPDFIAGLASSYDLDGGTLSPNGFWSGALGEDQDRRDVDFGYTGTGSIGDTIWFDQDLDGIQDPGEAGIAGVGVTVTWFGPDGVAGGTDDIEYVTTTQPDGTYLVDGLPAGNFRVDVDPTDLPAGYANVSDPDGGDDDTALTSLTAGENDLDQDFGYAGAGSIGDTIYLDQNGDGVQGPGEPGLAGVIVELVHFGPDGVQGTIDDTFVATTTDAAGNYLFGNLPFGDYEITVTGGITLLDNTDDPDLPGAPDAGDSMSTTTLTPGSPSDLDQDFGFFADSVLGDRVWWDRNGDGVQDPDEPGLAGVTITITSASVPLGLTATTDANGDYLFPNILDDTWTVTVDSGVPDGMTQTYDFSGSSTDGTSVTDLVTSDLRQDFGYTGAGSIGDTVWLDLDGDGTINGGEVGIEGVTITLTWSQPVGPPIVVTTVTGPGGFYEFTDLPNGDFLVEVDATTLPPGLAATYDLDGGVGGGDGSTPVTLTDGANTLDTVDFGFNGAGSIGDTIWFDRNGDGVLDGDESGLAGIGVTLIWDGPNGPEVFTTDTGSDGTYLFANLPPGNYEVIVDTADLPPGLAPTFDADGAGDSRSSLVLGDGENDLDQDFGYNGAGSIGDTIFLDLDGDGLQGVGEPGVPGQPVELVWQSPSGPVTYSTTTGADGTYVFDNLPPGDYTVTVVGGIVDAAVNTADPGGNGDSTNDLTLADGQDDLDQDFGYQGNNGIGDTVWYDVDADGIDDAGEPRLAGVDVTIIWFGADGVAGGGDDLTLPAVATNPTGNYLVGNLPDGNYSVEVTGGLPAGLDTFTFTAPGVTGLGVGTPGPQIDLDQDFAVTGSGSIGDTIWLDLDGDGTQDPGEPGIGSATVALTGAGADGVLGTADDVVYPTQTTDSDGSYLFEQLPAGPFRVDVSNLPAGVTPTADPDGGADDSAVVTLAAGASDLDQDFGYNGNAGVGDTVFIDIDRDGVEDPGEPGVPGVTVTVVSAGVDGVLGTGDDIAVVVTTDADGQYLVDGLPPGPTRVSYAPSDLPQQYLPSVDLDGGSPTSATVTLINGPDRLDVDFGVVSGTTLGVVGDATLTGTVWVDNDNDGVQDPGEPGIPNVTLEVIWAGPSGPMVVTVVTDANGDWALEAIPAGEYTATVVLATVPDGYLATTPTTNTVIVPEGGTNDVENGFVPGGSIGDTVWIDTNGNGIKDPDEMGVPGVTVVLTDENGDVVATSSTNSDGIYTFAGLAPGSYTVTISGLPPELVIVFDSDGRNDGTTTITLGPGDDRTDIDFGVAMPVLPNLPSTGGAIGGVLLAGLLSVLLGVFLLGARRRRQAW